MQGNRPDTEALLAQAGWLRALARRVAGEAGADDLVQEVWLKVAQRPPAAVASPRGWLASVLRSVHLRRRERREASDLREREVARPEALPSASELAGRADAQHALVEALLDVQEPWRRTLLLHYFEGHSAAEIARRDGEPATTVRSRIARGLEDLRARLDSRRGGREAWLPGVAFLAWPAGSARAAPLGLAAPVPSLLLPLSGIIMWKWVAAFLFVLVAWGTFSFTRTGPEPKGPELAPDLAVELRPSDSAGALSVREGERRLLAEPELAPEPLSIADPELDPAEISTRGLVVGPDGRPVAGATVFRGTLAQYARDKRGLEEDGLLHRTTDADGRFEWDPVDEEAPEAAIWTLSAHAEGLASSQELVVDARVANDVLLNLRRGGHVRGRVYGLDGQPVGGRTVRVSSLGLGEYRNAVSDEHGLFELEVLNPGPWRAATFPSEEELLEHFEEENVPDMVAYLAQAELVVRDGELTEIELARFDEDSPRVFGRLTWAGEPLRGVMQWYPAARPSEKQACESDASGQYEIRLPAPGRWIVHANAKAAVSRGRRWLVDLSAGQELELPLALGGCEITGLLVDPAGNPADRQRVELRSAGRTPHQPQPSIGAGYSFTRDGGVFRFDLVQPGSYRLVAHGDGESRDTGLGGAVSSLIEIGAEDEHVVVPDLVLTEGTQVEITLTDTYGRPVSGASVWFHGHEGVPLNPMTYSVTNGSGQVTSPYLPLGPVAVTAVLRLGASQTQIVNVGVEDHVELTLSPPRWIEVEDAAGPIDETRLRIGVVDADGREWGGLVDIRRLFESRPVREHEERPLFGPLPFGRYTVEVDGRKATVELGEATPQVTTAKVG